MNQHSDNMDFMDKMLYEYFDNVEVLASTTYAIETALYRKPAKSNILFRAVASVVTVMLLTTGVIFAKDIANFVAQLFSLISINIQNDSVVDAIENQDYVQNVDMDYIALDDNYKIKVDYLMLDDINLYMVFNLYSENGDIPEGYRLSILDLEITDENGNYVHIEDTVYDNSNMMWKSDGWKNISGNKYKLRELFFLISNNISKINQLTFKFTKFEIYNRLNPNDRQIINCNCNFTIDLIDKFINRNIIEYVTTEPTHSNYTIEKCIATDTGLYLLYNTTDPDLEFEFLTVKTVYRKRLLNGANNETYYNIIQYNVSKNQLKNLNKIEFTDSINNLIFHKNK